MAWLQRWGLLALVLISLSGLIGAQASRFYKLYTQYHVTLDATLAFQQQRQLLLQRSLGDQSAAQIFPSQSSAREWLANTARSHGLEANLQIKEPSQSILFAGENTNFNRLIRLLVEVRRQSNLSIWQAHIEAADAGSVNYQINLILPGNGHLTGLTTETK